MPRTRTALVIGGGIAGPATAMALRKAGIESAVYEAHPGGAEGVGAFLTLAGNGVDALRVLGMDAAALAAGFPTPSITLRSATGKHLGDSPNATAPAGGVTGHTIKRADLHRTLRDEASRRGIRIEYGRRLVAAETTGDGVRATFADGSVAGADVLIGCDGIHSTVRRIIDPDAPAPRYLGLLNTGGYARGVPVRSGAGRYEMIFGKRAFFGYAMAPDGDVWWFANVPRRGEPAPGELDATGGEEWRLRLVELFADDAGPAMALIRASAAVMAPGPIHAVPHLPAWHRGRMAVIGDAAHAPSPTSGQGASLSIEDGVLLAKCLRDVPDPEDAFARFEAVRRPRVEPIVRRAARMSNSKAAGPVGRAIRDSLMPVFMRMAANSSALRQTLEYHIDWDDTVPA